MSKPARPEAGSAESSMTAGSRAEDQRMRAWANERSGSSAKVETPTHQECAVGCAPRGMPLQPGRTIVRVAAQELPGKRCASSYRQTVVQEVVAGSRCRGRRFAHWSIQASGGLRELGGKRPPRDRRNRIGAKSRRSWFLRQNDARMHFVGNFLQRRLNQLIFRPAQTTLPITSTSVGSRSGQLG